MWVGVRWWRCCCYSCWLHALSLLFDHSPAHSMMCIFQAMEFLNLRQHKHQMHKSALWYRYHFRANLKVELVVLCLCRFFCICKYCIQLGAIIQFAWPNGRNYYSNFQWFGLNKADIQMHFNLLSVIILHIGTLEYWNIGMRQEIEIIGLVFLKSISGVWFSEKKNEHLFCQYREKNVHV